MNRLTARQRRNLGESLSGYSFILPQMLGFILFVLVPLVNVFIYSCHNNINSPSIKIETEILFDKLWTKDADIASILGEIAAVYRANLQ